MTNPRRLDEVATIIMGQAPPGESYNADGHGWPLIAGAGDFRNGRVAVQKYAAEATRLSQAGDIVLSIRASIGDKVMVDGEYCLGRGVAAIRAGTDLNSRFLWHYLTEMETELASKGKGATFKQVGRADIGELSVMLPSPGEQKRIAGVLDHADELRVKRRQTITLLDDFIKSIFLDMTGDPITNPRGWSIASIGEVSDRIQTGPFGSLLHREDYISDGIPLINPMHIIGGAIRPDPAQSVTTEKAAELDVYRLVTNDVVMGRRGEMGRCAVVTELHAGMLCGTGSLLIRPNREVLHPDYLSAVIRHPSTKRRLGDLSLGATLPNLNQKIVSGLRIAVPPAPLQGEFARRLAGVERLRAVHEAHLTELDELFASLQARAFRGEL